MTKISELSPKEVFKFFEEILKIPRPSKKEEKIIAYLEDFAKKYKLEYEKDDVGNIVIRKPATKGKENLPGVILQSHVDMVPEKSTEVEHNFETDPINAYIDGEWIRAKGTTLGADDGIGVAAALGVLASDNLEHPPLEAFFTVDEETGMTGAFGLKPNFLKGKILINLDSEDEGELFIGSAGGMDTTAVFDFKRTKIPENYTAYRIFIDKLHGGHSGDEIDKGYANAIKLISRFLWNLGEKTDYKLIDFKGGKLRNAIPKDASAIILIPENKTDVFQKLFDEYEKIYKNEFGKTDPELEFFYKKFQNTEKIIDDITKEKLILALYGAPHGVYSWSKEMENLVETSTNLATVKIEDNKIIVGTSQRSSVDTAKKDIATMVASVFRLAGANVSHSDGYPGWKPDLNSKILKITTNAYKELFGQEPIVRAIHAGLECGMFLEKYPDLDMISFGPTIKGAHTPEERLNIQTVQKFWDLLVKVLKNIN